VSIEFEHTLTTCVPGVLARNENHTSLVSAPPQGEMSEPVAPLLVALSGIPAVSATGVAHALFGGAVWLAVVTVTA
jgi:hypothetical protein